MRPLSEFLIRECQDRNLSFRAAAQAAGLDHNAISRYVAGSRPSRKTCVKLARFFGVSEEEVLILAGHMIPPKTFTPRTQRELRILQLFRLLPLWLQDIALEQLDLWLNHRDGWEEPHYPDDGATA